MAKSNRRKLTQPQTIIGLVTVLIVLVILAFATYQTLNGNFQTGARAADPCSSYTKQKALPVTSGTVKSKQTDRFTWNMNGNKLSPKIVVLCAGVEITGKSGVKLTYTDIKVGDNVSVSGFYGDTTGSTILASKIIDNSAPVPTPTLQSSCQSRLTLNDCNVDYYTGHPCDWYACTNSCLPRGTGACSKTFSKLSSTVQASSATYYFSYSGSPAKTFYIATSADPRMQTGVYVNFVQGSSSPISMNNPTKWDGYSCGRTLYWRITTEGYHPSWSDYSPELMSDIASSTISCQTPISCQSRDTLNYCNVDYYTGHPCDWYACTNSCLPKGTGKCP